MVIDMVCTHRIYEVLLYFSVVIVVTFYQTRTSKLEF